MPDSLAVTKKTVILGGQEFTARTVPVARVKQIVPVMTDLFSEIQKEQAPNGEESSKTPVTVVDVVDKVLEAPHRMYSLFIDGLPETVFTDPDNGATLPEILAAGKTILELNRLDVLKNVFSRLPTGLTGMLQQASLSRSTN